jgi:hypothetical protein
MSRLAQIPKVSVLNTSHHYLMQSCRFDEPSERAYKSDRGASLASAVKRFQGRSRGYCSTIGTLPVKSPDGDVTLQTPTSA